MWNGCGSGAKTIPGYWRRKVAQASEAPDVLQDALTPQSFETQQLKSI